MAYVLVATTRPATPARPAAPTPGRPHRAGTGALNSLTADHIRPHDRPQANLRRACLPFGPVATRRPTTPARPARRRQVAHNRAGTNTLNSLVAGTTATLPDPPRRPRVAHTARARVPWIRWWQARSGCAISSRPMSGRAGPDDPRPGRRGRAGLASGPRSPRYAGTPTRPGCRG